MTTTEPDRPQAQPDAPASRARRLGSALARAARSAIRQLSVAVYLFLAYALLARFTSGLGTWALEAALVLAGSALFARVLEGGLAATALAGLLFGLLQVGLGLALEGMAGGPGPWAALAGLRLAVPGLAGLGGAWLGRRWRRARDDAPRD